MMVGNQSEYAAYRNVSRQAVSTAVKEKRIPVRADGRIDFEAADAAWGHNTRVNVSERQVSPAPVATPAARPAAVPAAVTRAHPRPAGNDTPPPGSMAHAQLLHETAKARKAALEAQRLEGKLVPIDDVRAVWERHIETVKNRLLLLSAKVPAECRLQVEKEVRSLLNELSEYVDAA